MVSMYVAKFIFLASGYGNTIQVRYVEKYTQGKYDLYKPNLIRFASTVLLYKDAIRDAKYV